MSDGAIVMLKRTRLSVHPFETDIGQYFSDPSISSDPKNHCVPFLDVLQAPDDDDLRIIVMPHLRSVDDPEFDTVGEVVEFFRQVFEVCLIYRRVRAYAPDNYSRASNSSTIITLPIGTNISRLYKIFFYLVLFIL